jgi:hypothetical protein
MERSKGQFAIVAVDILEEILGVLFIVAFFFQDVQFEWLTLEAGHLVTQINAALGTALLEPSFGVKALGLAEWAVFGLE